MISSLDLPFLNMTIEQLDRGLIGPKAAKERIALYIGVKIKGRTKDDVCKAIGNLIKGIKENG